MRSIYLNNSDLRLFALPTINSLTRKAVLMSQNSDSPKSTRKQTTVFLLAFATATCAMFGPGTIGRGKNTETRVNSAQDLQKYSDISALPMAKRKAAFRKTSPQGKSNLWRTHFALYLAKHPGLSQAQRVIILEGMSLATPELFEVRSDNPDWKAKVQERLKQFESRIRGFFSRDEGERVFATLGDPEPPTTRSSSGTPILPKDSNRRESSISGRNVRTLNRFVGKNPGFEGEGFYCSCSTESDWCSTNMHCTSQSLCTITTSGCGTLWAYWCNGVCKPDYPD